MIVSFVLLIVEFLLCNIIFSPNGFTDMSGVSFALLFLNTVILCLSVNFSVDNEKRDDELKNKIKIYIIISIFLRIGILLWDIYCRDIFVLPNSEGDAVWYASSAESYAFFSRANVVDTNEYSYYVGQLYKIIGIQRITAQYLNVYFSVFSVVLIYKILCRFDVSSNILSLSMFFACFLPNMLMIHTFFLQESVIAFFVVCSLFLFVKWWFSNNFWYFLLSLVLPILGTNLHIGSIVPVIAYVGCYIFIASSDRKFRITPISAIVGVVLVIGALVFISANQTTLFGKIGGSLSSENIVSSAGQTDRPSDADYFIGIKGLPSSLDLIINSPIRMIYFVLSPLPWMWRNISDLFAFIFSALFYLFVCIIIIKTIKTKKTDMSDFLISFFIVLVIMLIVAALMFGWGVSNTGTALRHREKYTYVWIVTLAISGEILLQKRELDDDKIDISNCSSI